MNRTLMDKMEGIEKKIGNMIYEKKEEVKEEEKEEEEKEEEMKEEEEEEEVMNDSELYNEDEMNHEQR